MKYWAIEGAAEEEFFFQSLPPNVIQTLLNMGRCCEYQKKRDGLPGRRGEPGHPHSAGRPGNDL